MIPSQAIGPHEAAAVMGIHYTVPARMAERGIISAVQMKPRPGRDSKDTLVFDSAECDQNYHDYEEYMADRSGSSGGRPRAWTHTRADGLRILSEVEHRIAVNDAISVQEASEILHVHSSFVSRMVKNGEIIGRRAWGRAGRGGKIWIISRMSCLENLKQAKKKAAEGGHVGRPRKLS